MAKSRLLSTLALCATFFAFGVIALGAFTRLIDAGLGCPDWPGCYGHLTVPLTKQTQALAISQYPETHFVIYKAWAEMIHRYFVGGLSLFILSIIGIIFAKKEYRTRGNIILGILLISLLGYQIMLGQWTVTLKLLPVIVTQHLLGGFLILSAIWVIYLLNWETPPLLTSPRKGGRDCSAREAEQSLSSSLSTKVYSTKKPLPPLRGEAGRGGILLTGAIIAFILVFLQITLGAWTSTHYASLSCPDFPFCLNDNPFLTMQFKKAFDIFAPTGINYEGGVLPEAVRQTIQMTHRIGALILTLYLFIFSIFAMLKLKNYPPLLNSLYLILGLLILQLCIGITNIIFKLPLVTALLHNLIAVTLLLSVITLIYKLNQNQKACV